MTIELVRDTNNREILADAPVPGPGEPLNMNDPGDVDFGTVARFEATGLGANGEHVFRGSTVPLYLNGIGGLQLPMFVGRANAWSRPPTSLSTSHVHPLLAFMHGYLVAAGGDVGAATDLTQFEMYDLALLVPTMTQPAFPRAPKSLVVVGTAALLIDDAGATWNDFYSYEKRDAGAPDNSGFTFAQVAGGDVVSAGGDQYVVGATRATGPTNWILRVDAGSKLSAIALKTARTGAAAGAVRGGIYVSGGTVGGATSGGPIEICSSTECVEPLGPASEGAPAAPRYDGDPIAGHAIVEGVLLASVATLGMPGTTTDADAGPPTAPVGFLVGGTNPSNGEAGGIRTFNLDCMTAPCLLATRGTLPPLTRTRAFFLGLGTSAPQLLVIGETADGEDHAFWVDPLTAAPLSPNEIGFRQRRKGASVALFPNGQVGIVGGTDAATGAAVLSFELFAPP
jgi:hypothetical protein